MSGRFQPEKKPDKYARAIRNLVKAKVEHRAPEVKIAPDGKPTPQVINIMDALKQSMQKQGQAKVRGAVRKRMGRLHPRRKCLDRQRAAPQARGGACTSSNKL